MASSIATLTAQVTALAALVTQQQEQQQKQQEQQQKQQEQQRKQQEQQQQQYKQQLDTLTKVVETIRSDVTDVKQQQQQNKQQLDSLTKVVETIRSDVTEIKENLSLLNGQQRINEQKNQNSYGGRTSKVVKVGRINKYNVYEDPPASLQFPSFLGDLVTAGNEVSAALPRQMAWNAEKSLELIEFYDENYVTESSESENESDKPKRKKKTTSRRATVAKHLGITTAQLNGFQTAAYYE